MDVTKLKKGWSKTDAMDFVTIKNLGDQVHDIVLGSNLHSNWEVCSSIGGEEKIYRALLKCTIANRASNFEDVKLQLYE
jgi:hypothetical protein